MEVSSNRYDKCVVNLELKIGFGGGCHWCTEAVFQSLIGVTQVEQGWIASTGSNDTFSEAVKVTFNPNKITLKTLIEVHLHTHNSAANHTMRTKYRSAIYYFDDNQKHESELIIKALQIDFDKKIITKTLAFNTFKISREDITNYFYNNPKKPFCKQFIAPKLKLIIQKFSKHVTVDNLKLLASD